MKRIKNKQPLTPRLYRVGRSLSLILTCAVVMALAGVPFVDSTLYASGRNKEAGRVRNKAAAQSPQDQSTERKGIIWRAEDKWATEEGYNWEGIEHDLQDMSNAGAKWVRIAFKENLPLTFYDTLLPLVGEYNIQVLGNIRKSYPEKDLGTQAELDAYRAWLTEVVNRYQATVRYWEVENEPNIPSGWNICLDAPCAESDPAVYSQAVANYVQVLQIAYETVKAVDPALQVLIGGLCECGGERFIDELIRLDAQRYFDIMALHPFGRSPEEVMQRLDALKAKLALQPEVAAKPIWITAIGYHTAEWEGTPGRVQNEEIKADYLLQTMGMLSEVEGVEGPIFWYVLSEPVAPVNGYGLLCKIAGEEPLQSTYLPAYSAYQELWATKYVLVLPAIADSYVSRNFPNGNHGSEPELRVNSGADVMQARIKFDLSALAGYTLLETQLRFLTANSEGAGSTVTQSIKLDPDSSWSEESPITKSQPSTIVGTISNTVTGVGYQVGLDAAILQQSVGGHLSLAIDSTGDDELVIHSREWNSSLRLIVYYTPSASVAGLERPTGEELTMFESIFAGSAAPSSDEQQLAGCIVDQNFSSQLYMPYAGRAQEE